MKKSILAFLGFLTLLVPGHSAPIALAVTESEYSNIVFDTQFSLAVGDAFFPGAYNPPLREFGFGSVESVLADPNAANFDWVSGVAVPISLIWNNNTVSVELGSGPNKITKTSLVSGSIHGVYFCLSALMPTQDPKVALENFYYNGVYISPSLFVQGFGFKGYKLLSSSPGRIDANINFYGVTNPLYGEAAYNALSMRFGTTIHAPEPTSATLLLLGPLLFSMQRPKRTT